MLLFDRVKETTTTTGTGDITLAGAVSKFRAFGDVLANNDVCYYVIEHQSAAEWEVGYCAWLTGGTLDRSAATILASSNSGNAVNLSAGTKNVWIDTPANLIDRIMQVQEVTGTSATMVVNRTYVADNGSLVTLTLPTTAPLGSRIKVVGKGAGGWKVAQNASEKIWYRGLVTTTGTGGYIQGNQYGSVELVCTVADTEWQLTVLADGVTTQTSGENWGAGSILNKYTTVGSATWTKPFGATAVEILLVGAGGGGGSGRRGAAGTNRYGGGGGGAGSISTTKVAASQLGATETVVIGAGGTGGAAQTADDTNGNAGGAVGSTSFGSIGVYAASSGNGGSNAGGSGGSGNTGYTLFTSASSGSGTNGSNLNPAAAAPTVIQPGGGSGGAGVNSSDSVGFGDKGADVYGFSGNIVAAAGTANGGNGNDGFASDFFNGGSGGGGGNASKTATAVSGGNGGIPGGGGGGGGASLNGFNSGAGGNGGRGEIWVITYL